MAAVIEAVESGVTGGDPTQGDLVVALRHARARVEAYAGLREVPQHVRYALTVLEIAVEWKMPAVERWAVAWLAAAGGVHLRLRWSSRARDGRFRQDGRASGDVIAMAAGRDGVVVGTGAGTVERWTPERGLDPVVKLAEEVWTVTARSRWTVAGGPENSLVTAGWREPPPPPLPNPQYAVKAVAISPSGQIAVGDEAGRVLSWAPGGTWADRHPATGQQTVALVFTQVGAIRAAWSDGTVAESAGQDGPAVWRGLAKLPDGVRIAAWNDQGTKLAVAVGLEVRLGYEDPVPADGGAAALSGPAADGYPLWTHPELTALAWSPTDLLASAGMDQILISRRPVARGRFADTDVITIDQPVACVAFLGSRFVVSASGEELVQWDLAGAGSDDPTFQAGDVIKAIGVRVDDRRGALVGTRDGRLREYDGTGSVVGPELSMPDRGTVNQIAWDDTAKSWLIATPDGAYRYRPGPGALQKLSRDMCDSVAASAGRFAYAADKTVRCSDNRTLRFDSAVCDVRLDVDGTLAAIDRDGVIQVSRVAGGPAERRSIDAGSRLLAVDDGRMLLRWPDSLLRWIGRRGGVTYDVPPDSTMAARYDGDRVLAVYPELGVLLAGPEATGRTWARAGTEAVAAGPGRIVAASATHVQAYDVLATPEEPGDGSIVLHVRSSAEGFTVRLPTRGEVEVAGPALVALQQTEPDRIRQLSEAVFQSGRVGDLLWQSGLDLAIDVARGPDPHRPIRLRWVCAHDDAAADNFPWELLHPSAAPLGWFDEPPTTAVRVVQRDGRRGPVSYRPVDRPRMLVVRGIQGEMRRVDDAFDWIRRRTRRLNVRLLRDRPLAIAGRDALEEALSDPVEILQLWAHSDARRVDFGYGQLIGTTDLADLICRTPPRLVVAVGCSSGALGRALVERGVAATVAMRVQVDDHTVQPLIEDFTSLVLRGDPVDLAFAGALRRYVLTGQPGAAAAPMLHLAEDTDLVLFPGAGTAAGPGHISEETPWTAT